MVIPHEVLKKRHRKERDAWKNELSLRIHRALSWLHRAEISMEQNDEDGHFLFLWIAFNAAYASDVDEIRVGEGQRYNRFLNHLVALDQSGRLEALIWEKFSGPIRLLLDNKYVFQPFWDDAGMLDENSTWEARFNNAKKKAHQALATRNTERVLALVFSRLYTLRNQLVHGGSTCGSKTNRQQLRDGVHIMAEIMPLLLEIMMDNPNEDWGEVCYPVVA